MDGTTTATPSVPVCTTCGTISGLLRNLGNGIYVCLNAERCAPVAGK